MKLKFKSLAVLSIMSFALLFNGCTNKEKVKLPDNSEISSAGLDGIKQTDELEGSFVVEGGNKDDEDYFLSKYNIGDKTIEYTYTEAVQENKNITVTAKKMNEEEYQDFLPAGDTTTAIINGYDCTFISRTVHYVPDDYVPTDRVKANVEKGTTEIKYGSGTEQLLPIQKMYWYDADNQIGYCIEAIGQYYSLEDWSSFSQSYMEKAK